MILVADWFCDKSCSQTVVEDSMERNGWFFRAFFLVLTCIATLAYELTNLGSDSFEMAIFKGLGLGACAFGLIIGLEVALKRLSLRTFNTAMVGLFVGTLIGLVLTQTIKILLGFLGPNLQMQNLLLLFSFLASIYIGIMLTTASQDAWWLSIPFVRLAPETQTKKKEIIVDISALEDTRLIELARSGLLDHQLVVPTFIVKELQKTSESPDENTRLRARRCQEHLKRLESLEHLGLQIKEFHLSEQEELTAKLHRACRLIQAYLMTSNEMSQIRSEDEAATTISLEGIAATLKPGAQRGEILTIKIQRLGKEPKQGVGYLEDSTMVVVNGGGEFLGQTIRTQVLSQKYSSSGKIVFCNALTQDEKGTLRPPNGVPDVSPYAHPVTYS